MNEKKKNEIVRMLLDFVSNVTASLDELTDNAEELLEGTDSLQDVESASYELRVILSDLEETALSIEEE